MTPALSIPEQLTQLATALDALAQRVAALEQETTGHHHDSVIHRPGRSAGQHFGILKR